MTKCIDYGYYILMFHLGYVSYINRGFNKYLLFIWYLLVTTIKKNNSREHDNIDI